MSNVTITKQENGEFIAHHFLNGETHYGAGSSPGLALVELGFHLESLPQVDPIVNVLKDSLPPVRNDDDPWTEQENPWQGR